ncbi:MAG: ATP-binding protein [Candidatus Dependentiae bacterium]
MIYRDITIALQKAAKHFRAVAVLGPRQSGKKTLVQQVFAHHRYISFEDLDIRERAIRDPRLFLKEYPSGHGIILDEIQHVPDLLSYIQTIADREKKNGFFIITGSQNFLVNEAVSQTLAGRLALLTLYPLSIEELEGAKLLPKTIEEAVFNGCYPAVYAEDAPPVNTYANYIRTYVERDVRQIQNVTNLNLFQRFLQLCAGRIGQLLNLNSLANDCGIDAKTARAWLSILEASYVVFLLYPYYKNFGKRLIKSPKLYFVDTGIACSLLNIRDHKQMYEHYMRGSLIESYVISDLYKQYYNLDLKPSIYFWRDYQGNEIDCLLEEALYLSPIEIKAGRTVSQGYFKQFVYWKELKTSVPSQNFVIYSGDEDQTWPEARVLSWKTSGSLVKKLTMPIED